jgi:hypothetical protein
MEVIKESKNTRESWVIETVPAKDGSVLCRFALKRRNARGDLVIVRDANGANYITFNPRHARVIGEMFCAVFDKLGGAA